jgi:hypothetical protein
VVIVTNFMSRSDIMEACGIAYDIARVEVSDSLSEALLPTLVWGCK